ncbi:MAG TPA: cardiolipin synthase [Methanocorpusculum sp.]|nr:cardiolipin synthase [Methanocorpusculum sp.]
MIGLTLGSIMGLLGETACLIIAIANIIFCIVIIFIERRNPQTAMLWALLFLFIPIVGFILYLFCGRHLHKAHIYNKKYFSDKVISEAAVNDVMKECLNRFGSDLYGFENVARFNSNADMAILSANNAVERYDDGEAKFAAFRETIASAKKYIHLEYFIIRDDDLGREIIDLLAKKAREGVKVRAIFDSGGLGSIHGKKRFFAPLVDAGGDVRIFFKQKIPVIDLRINFRDHRKILVVDGLTGMIGGFNIGDEYLGKGKLGPWRDTHLRIRGYGVGSLQTRFIMDWNHVAKDAQIFIEENNDQYYYPEDVYMKEFGTSRVQIVSSGPDSPEKAIYYSYLSLMSRAKESVYIHSPYFVPDEAMLETFRIAIRSGIDVRIVIPCKPDHPFIYWANHSYLGDLIRLGARGYEYNDGFIHSKASIYDGKVASVGTANWDIRSFKLNFETQAFVYDETFASQMKEDFLRELETNCTEITLEAYNNRSTMTKIKEGICRLFSPLL